jgi:polyisoprenoid-binding protein YceI
MNRVFVAGALGAALAVVAGAPAFARSGACVYLVEPAHTWVIFSVSRFGLSDFSGVATGATGWLKFDPAHPKNSKLDVSVKTATVSTPDENITGQLRGADWLDAAKYPTARFVANSVIPSGGHRATVQGKLTLRGATRPVVIRARFFGAGVNPAARGDVVRFDGKGAFERAEFGMKALAPMVGDMVHVTINGAFELRC